MKALYFDGNRLSLLNRPTPTPAEREALVRVTHAGICDTDLEMLKGYMLFTGIPGHEFVGVVEQCRTPSLEGKRVVGEINCGCGDCPYCRRSDPRHCQSRTVLGISGRDGTFAEYTTIPVSNLHPLPDSLPSETAVLIEPLAACLEILQQVHIAPEHGVAIFGDGKLAQLAARVVRLTGARLLVIGKHAKKLELLEQIGVHTELLSDYKPNPTADVVIEATGDPSGFTLATRAVKPRGVIVLKSTYAKHPEIDLAPIVINEITIVGSRCGDFATAIRVLERDLIDVAGLISAAYPLSEWERAFETASSGALKVLIEMPSSPEA